MAGYAAAFDRYKAIVPEEIIAGGLETGQWSEETPSWFINLETRLTDAEKGIRIRRRTATSEEKLLMNIFAERSPRINEVLSRPPDYVARLNEAMHRHFQEVDETAHLLAEQVERTLDPLTEEERRLVRSSFGLDDGHSRRKTQIAEEFGMSVSEVSSILEGAFQKFRVPGRAKTLKDYLE